MKIIDVHVHIGSDYSNTYTAQDAIRSMDANQIDYAVISPVPSCPLPFGLKSTMEQNDEIAKALSDHPDRFVRGLGTVNPRHGEAAVAEVERIFNELHLHGLMFHTDKTGLSLDNPTVIKFIEAIPRDVQAVVLAHTSLFSVLESPFMLGKLARKFPHITFINGASMHDTTHSNCSRDLSAQYKNVYLDTACVHYIMHPITKALAEVDENQIVFGTDFPYYTIAYDKMIIDDADISEEIRNKIYYENAKRIFNL